MKKIKFKNTSDYLKHVQRLRDDGFSWYRGQKSNFALLPGIYRKWDGISDDLKTRIYLEEQIINDFYIYSPIKIDRIPEDGWAWLSLMQHYGLPTRLIDWSENSFQALFFSIYQWNTRSNEVPCIYLLDPKKLNQQSVQRNSVYVADNERLAHWLPDTLRIFKNYNDLQKREKGAKSGGKKPISIYTQHFHTRLSNQSGCFTLHGECNTPLEKYAKKSLIKLELNLDKKSKLERQKIKYDILAELNASGTNEFTTFDDLDHLSIHLKRVHGFLK